MKDQAKLMDCAQFKEIYHELDRPGTSGYRFRERALSHAEACSRCGALLTEDEALDFALRNLAERSAGWNASPRIEANLLCELQQVKLAGSRQRIRKQFAILGAAAAVLLALGIGVHQRITSGARTTSLDAVNGTGIPAAGTTTDAVAGGSRTPDESTSAASASANQADENEYAEEFVPVPYADDLAASEGGAIVRVTLPRSALASFGLPITESEGTDRVSADLIVSQDGTPQAIRLVSQENANSDF
jgi:hypothetical protein